MRLKRKLLHTFLRRTAMVALVVGLALSLFQGWQDQQNQLVSIERTVNHLVDAAMPSAAMAAYSIDTGLASSVVDGLALRNPIAEARIVSDFHDTLASAKLHGPQMPDGWTLGILRLLLGEDYQISRPLFGPLYHNQPLPVGYLEVTVSPALGGEDFLGRVLLGLALMMVQTVLLCAILTWVYLRTTLLPVERIVDDLQDIPPEPGDSLRPIRIPPGHHSDEIGYLVESFNRLIGAAELELIARRRAEDSLRLINEDLESRVDERTRHLHREIGERRTIENALRISENRFRDLAEVSSDWFWESDHNGRLTIISERFLAHTGLSWESVAGRSLNDLIEMGVVTVISPAWPELRRQIIRSQSRLTFEVMLHLKDGGHLRAAIAGTRFLSSTGKVLGYRGTGHDITRQYDDAEKLRLAYGEAERANAAKSEFLANMSHELRTPMNAILGFAQLLLLPRAQPLDPSQTQYVQHIIDAGDHLLGLINQVLDLARIEAGHLDLSSEPLDMAALAIECLDMLAPLAEKRSIQMFLDERPVPPAPGDVPVLVVLGDRVRLKQIVINLLSNAIKYNRSGGMVRLRLREQGVSHLTISIEDNGIGIPVDHLPKIFDPFHRVLASSQAAEGTGVGLAVTRRLVEAMNGSISVTSTEGEGSHFWFTIPRLTAASIAGWTPRKMSEGEMGWWSTETAILRHGTPLQVLYIEDNPANQALMQDLLAVVGGVTLVTVSTGSDALGWAVDHLADLVMIDINLPDTTGDVVARRLRQMPDYQTVMMVAISANVRAQDIAQARGMGFDDYLCKPFEVASVVNCLVEAKKRLSPEVSG